MDRLHAHPETQILGIAKAAFDAPALAIQLRQVGGFHVRVTGGQTEVDPIGWTGIGLS